MIDLVEAKEISDSQGNKIIGNFSMTRSRIRIVGNYNILYLDNVSINNSNIIVRKNNAILFGRNTRISNWNPFFINEEAIIFINEGLTSGRCSLNIGDGNLFIGKDCMFADDIHIQTNDGHLVYDCTTGSLLNPGKTIIFGDHCWIARGVMAFKGAEVGSGSVIGANSLISNKEYNQNCIYAGSPAKLIKQNVFWVREARHVLPEKEKDKLNYNFSKDFCYESNSLLKYKEIEKSLLSCKNTLEKYNALLSFSKRV